MAEFRSAGISATGLYMTDQDTAPKPPPQDPPADAAGTPGDTGDYRVLARKYRPTDFDGLIGQQAMVRTLTNAIQTGRMAHAFVLTGVRGVGKTTTARIIARALNCVGADGANAAPTAEPCGRCENCLAINEDRHMDVLEMDAASRTGVDDIRELIEGVRYRPTSARYKVYIIDEVHMLSRNAFNALLKTLEEPPEHVKFVFATTEVGKIPVTVLSRCQRFDLRRVDMETLIAHFGFILGQEGAEVADDAVHLIARAADGSVRDGLSLLDQAIAHGGGGQVDAEQVRVMLGLGDRGRTFDLLEAALGGDIGRALALMAEQFDAGANPAQLLEAMLELVHWLTRLKIVPGIAGGPGASEAERTRGPDMASRLSMASLARAWQMLLKGLGEVRVAPRPEQAAEMVVVRLAYAADLPTPAEAVQGLAQGGNGAKAPTPAAPTATATTPAPDAPPPSPASAAPAIPEPAPPEQPRAALSGAAPGPAPAPDEVPEPAAEAETQAATAAPAPQCLEDVIALADEKGAAILHANLINNVHLVHFEPGRVEFHPGDHAPADLANQLSRFLNDNTDVRWVVTVSQDAGAQTLRQQADAALAAEKAEAAEDPLVREVLEAFPGATIDKVRHETAPNAPEEEENA